MRMLGKKWRLWGWYFSEMAKGSPLPFVLFLSVAAVVVALKVVVVSGLALAYASALGTPVVIPYNWSSSAEPASFPIIAAVSITGASLLVLVSLAQGELESQILKNTILRLCNLVATKLEAKNGDRTIDTASLLTPFRLFLPIRVIVGMAPSISQTFVIFALIFYLNLPMGAFVTIFFPVVLGVSTIIARKNSHKTRKASSGNSALGKQDDEDDASGESNTLAQEWTRYSTQLGDGLISMSSTERVAEWFKTTPIVEWFDLRKLWRQSGVRGGSYVFAVLSYIGLVPAALVFYDLVTTSLFDLAAIAALVVILSQALSSVSSSIATLGRFQADVEYLRRLIGSETGESKCE